MLCVTRDSSSISIHFFVLNLVDWFGVLSNKFIIFWYFHFYYYINIKIINNVLYFFWIYIYIYIYIYLSLDISLSFSFVTVSELFCCDFFEAFVILPSYDLVRVAKIFDRTVSAILFSIKFIIFWYCIIILLF